MDSYISNVDNCVNMELFPNKNSNFNSGNEAHGKIDIIKKYQIYAWGRNDNGELGLGRRTRKYYSYPQ